MGLLPRRMFRLDARLAACGSFVRKDCVLADIGTDHAYLPIALVKEGKIQKAIAADVNEGPLQKANFHIRKYGVADQVQTRLSDGLEVIFPNEVDDIVIAGMGGELIAKILDAAPWVQNPEKHLILQPMTAAEELRRYLQSHGFAVLAEKATIADEKVYTVMLAAYAPEQVNTDALFPYIGLLDNSTPEGIAYIERQIRFFQNKATGLQKANRLEEAQQAEALIASLRRVVEGKERAEDGSPSDQNL